nr:hypothetical protein CFP56_52271 [Quercus suber]
MLWRCSGPVTRGSEYSMAPPLLGGKSCRYVVEMICRQLTHGKHSQSRTYEGTVPRHESEPECKEIIQSCDMSAIGEEWNVGGWRLRVDAYSLHHPGRETQETAMLQLADASKRGLSRCRIPYCLRRIFYTLADMIKDFQQLVCYRIEENDRSLAYVHRLRPGVHWRNHALWVARLADRLGVASQVAAEVFTSSPQPSTLGSEELANTVEGFANGSPSALQSDNIGPTAYVLFGSRKSPTDRHRDTKFILMNRVATSSLCDVGSRSFPLSNLVW